MKLFVSKVTVSVFALLATFLFAFASRSEAASTTIVISQVYGGGGANTGSPTFKNDYVVLYNRGTVAQSINGWSLQYGSATGTGNWNVAALPNATIQPGYYYLVVEGTAGTAGAAIPITADATGGLNLSATSGKVALANTTTALSGANPTGSSIVDLVGYGSANGYETSPVAALSTTTAALRNNNGATDTDNNSLDFTVGTPAPLNSSSPPYNPTPVATQVKVETAATGGTVVPAQNLPIGNSLSSYSISRDASNTFVANVAATWSLINKTGGVVDTDLVPAGDNKSATFTAHSPGTAVIHVVSGSLTSVDSGVITVTGLPTNPTGIGAATPSSTTAGQPVLLTVAVTPGGNPTSTGLTVTGDLTSIGGAASATFHDDGQNGDATAGDNVFSLQTTLPAAIATGAHSIPVTITDAQSRSAAATITVQVQGTVTIFHTNDTHARVTPHKWIVPQHSNSAQTQFEDVGGAAYLVGEMVSLTTATPDSLVLDAGDISEGNPVGDWNGPGTPVGTFGNGVAVEFYKMLDAKLKGVPGRNGRGLDAMVVGNHDIRDISYINNMKSQTSFPVISINICAKGTHTPYFAPYVIVTVSGVKVGIVGYTTESSSSTETAVNNLIDVVKCDWSSSDATKIHFADYVNDLRNNQHCDLVVLLTHDGHSDLCTASTSTDTPILVDNSAAKLPEVAITGHWHTWAETVWQPSVLNYKTIFTEAGCFMHYIGELRVNSQGKYVSNANYPLRNSTINPDADVAAFVQQRKDQYNATNPTYTTDQVIGYTADALLLDNYMKWWSCDEYPWSGNNTAGNWICDGIQWKATNLFGQCDLSVESGGGVRSDIPAGPITYTQIYETYPWADDLIWEVNMTGQQIWDYVKGHGCDVGLSHGWFVTAIDGKPTSITFNGQPIGLSTTYKVAISDYMYHNDTVPFTDPSPQTSNYLARTALVEYTSTFTQTSPYSAGPSRYSLNTEFSGGYRAVVMMMNDADSKTVYEDAFIRLLSANSETLGHRGSPQVPTALVNADGTVNSANRLSEIEMYRSYLGFKTGVLKPGDIIETWGKGSFYKGDPEFVDQEGIQSDGMEFKIVGHDSSLAQPTYQPSINTFFNQTFANHYVRFLAKKTGTNTVADQNGTALTIMDATAFTAKSLPGNVGDLLQITGIPTSESFALRFRADNAVLASSVGITAYPPASYINSVAFEQTTSPLALSATANAYGLGGTIYTLNPTDDATVSSGKPTTANGTGTTLFLQSSTNGGGFQNERSLFKFDLSSLPAGASVLSANLNAYCWATQGASENASAYAADTDTWTEAAVTWNTQPTFGASPLSTVTLASGSTNLYYSWDVTALIQTKSLSTKIASIVVKTEPENNTDGTAPQFKFDSKEYGSTPPTLQVVTSAGGSAPTVTQVQFFYRYSADNSTWGSWSSFQTATGGTWNASFSYPNGNGYYQFYSLATDSLGNVEIAPTQAEASVHYVAAPLTATVTLGGLSAIYDGTAHAATATTNPAGLTVSVTYDGNATVPVHAGSYAVVATVTDPAYVGSANGTLVIARASQTITFPAIAAHSVGDAPFAVTASSDSGLPVSLASSNPAVATVSSGTITIIGAGTTTITASQAGDSDHFSATPVAQTLTVNTSSGTSNGGDVPLLPPWALALLVAALAALTLPRLTQQRQK